MSVANLLSDAMNYAVVQLPGRAFPGVVFQGDSLAILIGDIADAAVTPDPDEREAAFEELLERLRNVQAHYESVLARHNIALPYVKKI